jgi:ribonuclease HI
MCFATVITDASFDDKTGKAGWAAWIRVDGVAEPIKKYASFKNSVKTSMDAERLAAINGIYLASRYGATRVLLQSDCLGVIHLIDGTTRKRSAISEWYCAKEKAGILGVTLFGKHVKGHTSVKDARSHVNRWCDKMANKARKSS